MTTFFTIFFVLVLINAALLIFSLLVNKRKQSGITHTQSASFREKVYPLDLSSSEYRKAI